MRSYLYSISIFCYLLIASFPSFSQSAKEQWVDSVYQSLDWDGRIGQLFMVAAYSNRDETHYQEIDKLIEEQQIGGLIFFQGGPVRQGILTNRYQSKSKVPLMISMDLEWGLTMRLDSVIGFPRQLYLGALQDDRLVYEMGKYIAYQCKRLGVHMNLAPVVDINNNPNNPVINDRSFGEDKFNVSLKGLAYMQGMQHHGVLACAKHFPGHGDTDADSHLTLPVINHDRERLDELELYPFKILINAGVAGVMAAHIHIPKLDSTPNLAASLSPKITTDILKKELGFKGLVISDALNMKGVSQFYAPGDVDLEAYKAGNDILLFSENVPRGIQKMKDALASGEIDPTELGITVKKILAAKYDAGLSNLKPVKIEGLIKELNTQAGVQLNKSILQNAITVLSPKDGLLPIQEPNSSNFASLRISPTSKSPFHEMLLNYAEVEPFYIREDADEQAFDALLGELKEFDVVFVDVHGMSRYSSKKYGLQELELKFLHELKDSVQVVLTLFGSPYSLRAFSGFDNVVIANVDETMVEEMAAQVIFGGIGAQGKLPISAGDFKYGEGKTYKPTRLGYVDPEDVGLDPELLLEIDKIAYDVINDEATPGCQILFAKDGKVFYHKAFGHHRYGHKLEDVLLTDLYDLASITKIAATTISLMKLYEEGAFKLEDKLSDYLPQLKNTHLDSLIIQEVLTHTSGLPAWIPFYLATVGDTIFDQYYCNDNVGCFTIEVAEDLFIANDIPDTIFYIIENVELNEEKDYRYSDLGFYLFKQMIERITKKPMEEYVQEQFYQALGLQTMTYRPLEKFPKERILPTEQDSYFRNQLVHGYVHDPGAAMLGGVSGHAGLFSNANDLAIIGQMLLNYGNYGGIQYFDSSTVTLFTSQFSDDSRRGLGFDKPEMDQDKISPACDSASYLTFGHSGFTGTCIWVDPKYDLVYVFLSNRVYPTAENKKLIRNNVRTDIQQVVYDAIVKEELKVAVSH